jgi:hypothetical protein
MDKFQYYHHHKKQNNPEKKQEKINFCIQNIGKDKLIKSLSNVEHLKCKLQSHSGIKIEKEIEFYVFSMTQKDSSGKKFNLNLRFKGLYVDKKAYLDEKTNVINFQLSVEDYQKIVHYNGK